MNVVEAQNLRGHYITHVYGIEREVKAVDNVSLNIKENEILGIAGESGCGKTTLLKILFGMINPPLTVIEGQVSYIFNNQRQDILSLNKKQIKKIRWKQASYVPQGSMSVLNPVRRVKHTFRDFISAHRNMNKKAIDKMVIEHLRDLGLPAEVMNSYPHQLSGGMRQRVTIALATILNPDVIFADEPTTALDVIVQRGVIQLLKRIQREEQISMVIVTHDMAIHANLTDRIAIMYAGNLIEVGDTVDVFKEPLHYYTKYLINSLPKIGDKSHRISTPGNPPQLDNPPSGCRFHERCSAASEKCRKEVPPFQEFENGHKVACFQVSREQQEVV